MEKARDGAALSKSKKEDKILRLSSALKNKKLEEIKVKVYATDYQEAFNLAIKKYPDYVIYQ